MSVSSYADYHTIAVSHSGNVVTVALDRPDVHNAFTAEMIVEVTDVFLHLGTLSDVRVVVLSGNGPSFSAGADINWMRASLDASPNENLEDARRMSDMFEAINVLPQPVIGRVQRAALGGGMGLMAVCDIVIAERGAVFGFTEAKLGIVPAVISRFVVPKIGESWARALFLTAERFGAELAQRIGLVHHIVEPEELDSAVADTVRDLLSSGPQATRAGKSLVREVVHLDSEKVRDYTAVRIAELRTAPEGQEGLRAFLEKRKPSWRG